MRPDDMHACEYDPSWSAPSEALAAAAAWHARLRADDAGADERARFSAWLAADVGHRLAYAEVCSVALAVDALDPVQAAIPRAAPRMHAPPAPRRWPRGLSAAALLMLAGVLAVLLPQHARLYADVVADHRTAVAEHRRLTLADGSRVLLGADSAIRLRFDDGARRVELLRGRADFDVAADPSRPFTVHAGALAATALGTRYEVASRADGVQTVAVEHGRVRVDVDGRPPVTLGPGQALRGEGEQWLPHPAAPADTRWRDGLLVFEDAPLAEVIARLAPYVDRGIRIGPAVHAHRARVTVAVPVEQAEATLHALAAQHGLSLRRRPLLGLRVD